MYLNIAKSTHTWKKNGNKPKASSRFLACTKNGFIAAHVVAREREKRVSERGKDAAATALRSKNIMPTSHSGCEKHNIRLHPLNEYHVKQKIRKMLKFKKLFSQ